MAQSTSISPNIIVTFVHGTFARDAKWTQPDAPLSVHIRKALGEDVYINVFNWSGKNSVYARTNGARHLAWHLETLQSHHPKARHYVIAHSHGGNVALYAASIMQHCKIAGIVCLSTPFLQARARNVSMLNGQNLQVAIGLLFGTITFLITVAFGAGWLWKIGLTLASSVQGGIFATLIGKIVHAFAPLAEPLAKKINASVPDGTDILIVRAVGDEASFVLGAAQLLSWASLKAFD